MKKIIIFVVILSLFTFTSLTNYNDLDKLLLATSIIVDKTNDGNYSIYVEAFTSITSTSGKTREGERTIIHAEGNSLADLINDLNAQGNFKLNYTHNRLILFTEKAARDGIDDILDCFSRPEEFLIRNYIAVIHADPEKMYTIDLKGEKFMGLYLINQLTKAKVLIGNTEGITLAKLDNESSYGSETCIIPIIKIIETTNGDNLDFKCVGILRKYKLIGELDNLQAIYINFLLNRILTTTIDADNPSSENKLIGLRVIKAKTKTKYNYTNDEFQILKDITVHTVVRGSFGKIRLTNKNVKEIEKNASSRLKNECEMVFLVNKEKGIDVLNVQEKFYRHYPKYSNTNILNSTNLLVNVNVIVDLSTDPKDFDY